MYGTVLNGAKLGTWQGLLWLQPCFIWLFLGVFEKNFAFHPSLLKFLANVPLFYGSWRCYSCQTNKQFVEVCLLDCDLCFHSSPSKIKQPAEFAEFVAKHQQISQKCQPRHRNILEDHNNHTRVQNWAVAVVNPVRLAILLDLIK